MKKLLFVNACVRSNSRTERLARSFLETLQGEYSIRECRLAGQRLLPFDEDMLRQRDLDIAAENFTDQKYALAHEFAEADQIVIAAPYWDCLFPAKLKLYLEHICVCGITFAYTEEGKLKKCCRAQRMICISTAGGYLPKPSSADLYIHELGTLFSIEKTGFYVAEALDIFPEKVENSLVETLDQIKKDW